MEVREMAQQTRPGMELDPYHGGVPAVWYPPEVPVVPEDPAWTAVVPAYRHNDDGPTWFRAPWHWYLTQWYVVLVVPLRFMAWLWLKSTYDWHIAALILGTTIVLITVYNYMH